MPEPESDLPKFNAPHILLVEDSPGEAELFHQAVVLNRDEGKPQNQGLRPKVDVAHSAKSALDALRKQAEMSPASQPSPVVLDLDLPVGSGPTFLQEIRQDSRFHDLPVIGLLWAEDETSIRSLDGLGLLAYEVKPLFFADLLTLVGRFCRHFFPMNPRLELCGQDRGLRP